MINNSFLNRLEFDFRGGALSNEVITIIFKSPEITSIECSKIIIFLNQILINIFRRHAQHDNIFY